MKALSRAENERDGLSSETEWWLAARGRACSLQLCAQVSRREGEALEMCHVRGYFTVLYFSKSTLHGSIYTSHQCAAARGAGGARATSVTYECRRKEPQGVRLR